MNNIKISMINPELRLRPRTGETKLRPRELSMASDTFGNFSSISAPCQSIRGELSARLRQSER